MDHVVVVTWIGSADYNWVKISAHTNDRHNISFLSFMNEARKMENVHYVNYRIWKVSYWKKILRESFFQDFFCVLFIK